MVGPLFKQIAKCLNSSHFQVCLLSNCAFDTVSQPAVKKTCFCIGEPPHSLKSSTR